MNNTSNDVRPLLHNIKDTCQRLGISKSTVYKLVGTGELDARKVAGRTVITDASLVHFAANAPKAPIRSAEGL